MNPSLLLIPDRYKSGVLYSQLPESGAGDLDFTRGSTATRVNALGLIESVASGVPRLDYTGGGCPSLLLEPQRTNLALSSEDFTNLTYWFPTNVTTTANTTISPDGTLNADTANFGAGANALNSGNTFAGNSDVTISVFVKAGSISIFRIRESFYIGSSCVFDLTAKTAGAGGRLEEYPNGWFRCSFTYNLGVGQTNINWIFDSNTAAGTFFLWGAQAEAGSYATSYIPTTTAAVTRAADVASKTGISSLIGQTSGTIFIDFNCKSVANTGSYDSILNIATDANNSIDILKNNTTAELYVFAIVGGVIQVNSVGISGTNILGNHKVALAYNLNDYVCYLDGVQVFTDTSATVPACSSLYLGQYLAGTGQLGGTIKTAALYTTRLSNAELATLTAL